MWIVRLIEIQNYIKNKIKIQVSVINTKNEYFTFLNINLNQKTNAENAQRQPWKVRIVRLIEIQNYHKNKIKIQVSLINTKLIFLRFKYQFKPIKTQKMLNANPDKCELCGALFFSRGYIHQRLGEVKLALNDYTEALKHAPKHQHLSIYENRARVCCLFFVKFDHIKDLYFEKLQGFVIVYCTCKISKHCIVIRD